MSGQWVCMCGQGYPCDHDNGDPPRECGGAVNGETATRESLIASGMTPDDADKVLAFRDDLLARPTPEGQSP